MKKGLVSHLILNYNLINSEIKDGNFSDKEKKKYIETKELIKKIRELGKKNKIQIKEYDELDLISINNFFNSGEKVIIYGAYLENPIKQVKEKLTEKGVKVFIHRRGCVKFYSEEKKDTYFSEINRYLTGKMKKIKQSFSRLVEIIERPR